MQQLFRRGHSILGRNQDLTLALAFFGVLMVLFIPLPTWVLDVLLTLNISVSVVVLLATLYLQRPVEFAVFPSLLLLLTLFRLSLNVASTRLILAEAYAGAVIETFGGFVDQGEHLRGDRDLSDPRGNPVRRDHAGRHAHLGSGRALHLGRDARQADGRGFGSERRADYGGTGPQTPAGHRTGSGISTARWTAQPSLSGAMPLRDSSSPW